MLNKPTPEYVFDGRFTWDYWTYTSNTSDPDTLAVGNVMYSIEVLKEDLDDDYPGFVNSYNELVALNCDDAFVTKLLKFCIINAQGNNMLEAMRDFDLLQKIHSALALGLTAEELLAAIAPNNPAAGLGVLPENMA